MNNGLYSDQYRCTVLTTGVQVYSGAHLFSIWDDKLDDVSGGNTTIRGSVLQVQHLYLHQYLPLYLLTAHKLAPTTAHTKCFRLWQKAHIFSPFKDKTKKWCYDYFRPLLKIILYTGVHQIS